MKSQQKKIEPPTWECPASSSSFEINRVLNKFKPRWYQDNLIKALWKDGKKRALLVWSRRAGKDMICWQLAIWQCLKEKCTVFYVFPTQAQARTAIWSGITIDGKSFLDYIPKELGS
jgi:hypothetical protein